MKWMFLLGTALIVNQGFGLYEFYETGLEKRLLKNIDPYYHIKNTYADYDFNHYIEYYPNDATEANLRYKYAIKKHTSAQIKHSLAQKLVTKHKSKDILLYRKLISHLVNYSKELDKNNILNVTLNNITTIVTNGDTTTNTLVPQSKEQKTSAIFDTLKTIENTDFTKLQEQTTNVTPQKATKQVNQTIYKINLSFNNDDSNGETNNIFYEDSESENETDYISEYDLKETKNDESETKNKPYEEYDSEDKEDDYADDSEMHYTVNKEQDNKKKVDEFDDIETDYYKYDVLKKNTINPSTVKSLNNTQANSEPSSPATIIDEYSDDITSDYYNYDVEKKNTKNPSTLTNLDSTRTNSESSSLATNLDEYTDDIASDYYNYDVAKKNTINPSTLTDLDSSQSSSEPLSPSNTFPPTVPDEYTNDIKSYYNYDVPRKITKNIINPSTVKNLNTTEPNFVPLSPRNIYSATIPWPMFSPYISHNHPRRYNVPFYGSPVLHPGNSMYPWQPVHRSLRVAPPPVSPLLLPPPLSEPPPPPPPPLLPPPPLPPINGPNNVLPQSNLALNNMSPVYNLAIGVNEGGGGDDKKKKNGKNSRLIKKNDNPGNLHMKKIYKTTKSMSTDMGEKNGGHPDQPSNNEDFLMHITSHYNSV